MPALILAENGTVWDAEIQSNPDVTGNESRNSFKWNCYHSKLGQFFQGAVKDAILRAINAVHNKNIYYFESEFLTFHNALYEAIKEHIRHDAERKQPFMFQVADILVYYAQNECDIKKLQKNKLFRTSVDFAFKGIKKYDSEAFIYDDVRLQMISTYLKKNVDALFDNDTTFQKVIDIVCFLMKEDIYYRPRFIKMLQDIQKKKCYPGSSELVVIFSGLCELVNDFELTQVEIENIERWH